MNVYDIGTVAIIISFSSFVGALVSIIIKDIFEKEKGFMKWLLFVLSFIFIFLATFLLVIIIEALKIQVLSCS